MPRIITLDEKLAVIDDWLSGESRNDIAIKRDMGNGTVYNIYQEWRDGIGVEKAEKLRVLALKLKKTGLTVNDCVKGLRTLMSLNKYGIKKDEDHEHLTYFLKEVYTKCQEVGFTSQQVFAYISDILKFSSEVSLSQIPSYMKKITFEKQELENTIQKLSNKINELTSLQEEKEHEVHRLSKVEETMTKNYRVFLIAKAQLAQHGIGVNDMNLFVKSVVGISNENYDLKPMLAKIADYENLKKNLDYYKDEINLKKNELARLVQDINVKKNDLNILKVKLEIINELEMRGFGIIELRTLFNILNEIGLEKNQNFDVTIKKFFDDVKNYVEVIGSRIEIDRLKNQRKILEEQIMKEREKYIAYPTVIESILRLAGSGINEQDIIKIDKILMMTDYYPNKDKPLYKEKLIDDLQLYRNLKIAIKNLEDIEINLKSTKKTQNKPAKKKRSAARSNTNTK